ncbi:hypothetical protein FRC09_008939 [Ceratobasidium sp. 395]|nr:hypothetical protein FRC09_008939 [Ceratobasidium sp. 395]
MAKRKASSPVPASKSPKKRQTTKAATTKKPEPEETFEQFKPTPEFEDKYKLDLPGAETYYKEDFIEPETANEWYEELNCLETCHPVQLHTDYPATLRRIQDMVESELGVTFNHVMLNRYEDGSVYIGKHSDNKENKVIASVSLGAVRTFIMTPKVTAKNKGSASTKAAVKRWDMANGSLFVMQGDTQENWKLYDMQ